MTPRRVVTTTRADEDVDGAVTRYLGEAGPTIALAFIDDLQHAVSRIAAYPSLGSARFELLTEIPDLRAFPLRKHPYLVIYTDDADAVRVHRVLHTKRDIAAVLTESERATPPPGTRGAPRRPERHPHPRR
ncbi:type II toxin-antitoxin system RelE/ParE family toxin [Microbacterium paraoxydans]|uniref:Type II toxin-antitoxin system RelE/ParE family toxin n=1 Tax=Microbacterium paraoxydans TaxID=199592 RepID=A0ABS5IIH7_9MICO|nr:type II toxin-antitoxin system RelE/ParE family toxin [Microbacterium paraoxydans]MBS0022736.1 type II toxin-antitoxin system RelE/ParE family toxin [Microbacterium paraoxydans]